MATQRSSWLVDLTTHYSDNTDKTVRVVVTGVCAFGVDAENLALDALKEGLVPQALTKIWPKWVTATFIGAA